MLMADPYYKVRANVGVSTSLKSWAGYSIFHVDEAN